MYLASVSIEFFRNYEQEELNCSAGVVCIYGPNGSGKTNLLDAIHYLCSAKSAWLYEEEALLRKEATYFRLQAQACDRDMPFAQFSVRYALGEKKKLQIEGKPCARRRDYAQHLPVVMFSSADYRLIQGSSQLRRDFIDAILVQEDASYATDWLAYRNYLRGRNAALRAPLRGGRVDRQLVRSYDERLLPLAARISEQRMAFMQEYVPLFQKKYAALAEEESVNCVYSSALQEDDFQARYEAHLEEDIRLMRTQMGIHKDDYLFELDGSPIRTYASQGQQKTFLWALKLAEVERIYQLKKRMPLMLLDDMMDKLDITRTRRLFSLLIEPIQQAGAAPETQIFITSPQLPEMDLLPCDAASLQLVRIEQGRIHYG